MLDRIMRVNIYDWMLAGLIITAAISSATLGIANITQIIVAVAATVLTEFIAAKIRKESLYLPKSAMISGLLIGLIAPPLQPIWIYAIAGITAIAIKNIIKIDGKHIFNPASTGIVLLGFVGYPSAWWGLFSSFNNAAGIFVTIFALWVLYRLGSWNLAATYLIVYLALFGLAGNTNNVFNELQASLPFAALMLIEPRTAPTGFNGKVIFGALAGIFSLILHSGWMPTGGFILDYWLVALLLADLFVPLINRKLP